MRFNISLDDNGNIEGVVTQYGDVFYSELPDLVKRAIDFAKQAHEGQKRKDGVTPYIVHPWCVLAVCVACKWHFTDEELAAVVLHDVIEDTVYPFPKQPQTHELRAKQFEKILSMFGEEVASIVWLLTKPIEEDCRRKIYRTSLRRVAPSVIALKMADAVHNLYDLPTEDQKFVEFFKKKVVEDILPLLPILRMHGSVWHSVANWFESLLLRGLA